MVSIASATNDDMEMRDQVFTETWLDGFDNYSSMEENAEDAATEFARMMEEKS